jgi:predicted small integral membrane protein
MTRNRSANLFLLVAGAILLAILGLLVAAVPQQDGIREWSAPLVERGWMAWTFPTGLFFVIIAALLVVFTWAAIRFPETPRIGVLHIETTRGDRLFITLLGSAFISLAWLAAFGAPLWGALAFCLIYAAAVFRWV